MGALANARILLVDEDAGLLGLLQSLLEEAGCVVETVCGLDGFTPELMSLSKPQVVFLNPRLKGMEAWVLRGLLHHFRKLQPRASVVLIGHRGEEELQQEALDLEADGYVPTARLLRNPVHEIPTPVVAEPARSPNAPPRRAKVADLAPEEILELTLEVPDAPPPREATPKARPPVGASLGEDLVKLIEDEMLAPEEMETVEQFEVSLDVLNENNLYGPAPGKVAGVFVAASVRPIVGATVELTVRFPWGTKYDIVGVVEWAQDLPRHAKRSRGGFGVKLPEITPLQRSMFDRFATLRQPMLVAAGG